MANCVHCGKELTGKRRKYCNDSCAYWFKSKQRDETAYSGWGSANSQIRLNKACSRFASRMRSGRTSVRYM